MARVIDQVLGATTSSVVGEITRELVNASDGAGLHLEAGGTITLTNAAAAEFGTSDFSLEFVLNRTANNTNNNVIYESHSAGNNRVTLKALTGGDLVATFTNSSGVNADYNTGYDIDVDLNTVTHYALTFDRSGDLTVYKNGNSVATISIAASSAVDIGLSNTNTGRIGYVTTYGVIGTFYRIRTWNKLLSSAEVQTAYERADVDFADQYGSQTEKIGDAANRTFASGVGNWGAVAITAVNDSGALKIPQTAAFGGGTNNLAGFAQRSFLGKDYFNTGGATENNKRYRLSFDAKAVTGGSKLYFNFQNNDDTTNTALNESVTLTTSFASYSVVLEGDFGSAPKFLLAGLDAAESFWLDNVSIVAVGCVSDYDLAFANENQSRMVADRSTNNVDGEMSSSGVKQTQVIKQLNSTAMRVGGTSATAATPADGEVVADTVSVTGTGHDAAKITITNTANANARLLLNSGHGNWSVCNSDTIGDALEFRDESANATRLSIDSTGNVLVGAAALDANLGAKKMQLEGSASTSVGPEMLLHNPAQGGGAASLLTFGGKASGTEGYTAAIKATNTGTLTIGTAHASGGFSEPSADLTINSTGTVSVTNATSTDIGTLSNETQLYLENSTANKPVGITFGASNASGGPSGTGTSSARVSALASGGAGVFDADLVFETRSGSTIAERMRIASDGNIEQHTDSNGIVKFVVKNESTGTSARAMVNVISDHGNLDLSMNGTNYTGVAGWADSGVVSTGSVVGGGLKLNAVAGGLALQTNQTTRVSIANSTGLASFSNGIKNEQGIYGGQITIADDAVGTITPPRQGVMMAISYGNDTAYPAHGNTVAIIWCDTGSSLTCAKLTGEGTNISVFNAVNLSAAGETSSVDNNINISTTSNTIQIKNRLGGTFEFWYNFIA